MAPMELANIHVTAPESDADKPPRSTKPTGFSSYTNGAFKRRHCITAAPPPPPVVVSYRECMRNHAAGIGGHALDGCCEFMPSPDADSFRCAACGCHRNFHRRDPDDPAPLQLHRHRAIPPETTPPATRSFYSGHHVSLKKNLSGSDPVARVSPTPPNGGGGGRKRFRTRFSQEQKEKMYEFAEKLGWKLQRIDKRLIEEFCGEIGVGKEVLKVWMHNNKNTLGKREIGGNVNGGIIDGDVEEKIAGNGNGVAHIGGNFKPVVTVGSGDGSFSSSG